MHPKVPTSSLPAHEQTARQQRAVLDLYTPPPTSAPTPQPLDTRTWYYAWAAMNP